jgi:hypothetical protein
MIGEIIYLIISIVVCIAVMVRYGFLIRFTLEFLGQRILEELSCLKVSAPNLTHTFEANSSPSL